jgi:hypothetical protein
MGIHLSEGKNGRCFSSRNVSRRNLAMPELQNGPFLFEVQEFAYVRGGFGVTVKVQKDISGNAPQRYTCYVSSMDIPIKNKDFVFHGGTEQEVFEKMVEKLNSTEDLKAIFSQGNG